MFIQKKGDQNHWINYDLVDDDNIDYMEFRLVYEGELKQSSNRNKSQKPKVEDKHRIRQQFHPQLAALWNTHPAFANMREYVNPPKGTPKDINDIFRGGTLAEPGSTYLQTVANNFNRFGYNFVPLVTKQLDLYCGLDILFLRRENPGDLVLRFGDIDNRIKTLLDALKVPGERSELPKGASPETDENPFYCLVQDDCLISELNVKTDRLYTVPKPTEDESDVMLIMNVKIQVAKIAVENRMFA